MKIYKVIGLMSGTSLDGLDLAYCHIWQTNTGWDYKIKQTKSVAYNLEMKLALKKAIHLSALDLLLLNNTYGTWLGKQVKQFIEEFQLEIDFISSHGHTVHHQPKKGLTYQIGSGQHIANASGYKVVCDFRINDVALGGQGAPLVPIGDQLFFSTYDFCLNLGGISNISFQKDNKRIAYDIGLANMVLNYSTQKINIPFDKGGKLAKKGKINKELWNKLNSLEYYKLPFPKSTGYEWFSKKVIPIIEATNDNVENLLHTCIHHICQQIAIQVLPIFPHKKSSMLVTGGGALNNFLIETLQLKLGNQVKLVPTNKTLIEFKEALIFALMGVLRVENKVNALSSVTGAKRDTSGGVIFLPSFKK